MKRLGRWIAPCVGTGLMVMMLALAPNSAAAYVDQALHCPVGEVASIGFWCLYQHCVAGNHVSCDAGGQTVTAGRPTLLP